MGFDHLDADHYLSNSFAFAGIIIGMLGMGTGIYLTITSLRAQLWGDVLTYAALTGAIYYFYAHTWNHPLPSIFGYNELLGIANIGFDPQAEPEEPPEMDQPSYTRSSYSCGHCGEKGHNARKCPNRQSAEWEWY